MVTEELKQGITANRRRLNATKEKWIITSKTGYFKITNGRAERRNDEILDAEKMIKFWNEIWSKQVDHNRSARRIHDIEKQTNEIEKLKKVKVTAELIAKQV